MKVSTKVVLDHGASRRLRSPLKRGVRSHEMNWAYFPRSATPPKLASDIVGVFEKHKAEIDSQNHQSSNNDVLRVVAKSLKELGFLVESGKKKAGKIYVPVLYGNNGKVTKAFEADAPHLEDGFVIEVEADRATINNQFLKESVSGINDGWRQLSVHCCAKYLRRSRNQKPRFRQGSHISRNYVCQRSISIAPQLCGMHII